IHLSYRSFRKFFPSNENPIIEPHHHKPFFAVSAHRNNWHNTSGKFGPPSRARIVIGKLGLIHPLMHSNLSPPLALDPERWQVNIVPTVPSLPQLALDHLAESIGEDAAQFALAAGALRALRLAHAALGATARSNSRHRQFWHASICFVVLDRGTSSLLQPLQRGVGMGTHAGIGIGLRSSDMLFLAPGLRQLCTHKRLGKILRVVLDAVRSE